MSYQVKLLDRAAQDFDKIIAWISERSPAGADRLAARFEEVLAGLGRNPFIAPVASESEDLGEEIRHILFRTRAGRPYRALFVIVGQEVRILRVRGPGQPPLTRSDIEEPG